MTADKTYAAVLGGAAATVLVFVLGQLGVEVPPEVATAIATLCAAPLVFYARNRPTE